MKVFKTLLFFVFAIALTGCDLLDVDDPIKVDPKVELTSQDYSFMESNLELEAKVDGKVSDGIQFSITGENTINARIEDGKLVADSPGTVSVIATYNGIESTPKIVFFMPKNETVINVILSNDMLKLDLGKTYSFGLDVLPKDLYTVTSSNPAVLQVTDNNNITIVGVGRGSLKVVNNKDKTILYDDEFVVYNSILVTEVKNILINKGIINSMASELTSKEFDEIKEISLDRKLVNDPTVSVGLKVLKNLSKIRLGFNELADISFVSDLSNLEEIYLNNNLIEDLTPLNQLKKLRVVDLSYNNIENIATFRRHEYITNLYLTGNRITDLSPISTLYGLKKLHIGKNNIDSVDHISGLLEIDELDISYANVSATDIFGLDYFNQLEYIDMSGITFTLSNLPKGLSKLKVLKLDNCELSGIEYILNYDNLEELSIESNDLDLVEIETFFLKIKELDSLKNLKRLSIGGNSITSIPENIENLKVLEELNLANSYNLIEITNLSKVPWIKKLNLSKCNSIQNNIVVKETFTALEVLESLSIVEGLNYIDRELFDYLMERVEILDKPFEVEIFEGEWIRSNTIVNYKSIIYFSIEEFKEDLTLVDGVYNYNYKNGQRKLILNLINDTDLSISNNLVIRFSKDVFEVNIYGSKFNTYSMSFTLENRKQSSFTYNLYNFKNNGADNNATFSAPGDSKLIVNFNGESIVKSKTGQMAFNVYDLEINANNGNVIISGANGVNGANGPSNKNEDQSTRRGQNGTDGSIAINANIVTIKGINITITGGSGGTGGNGGNSTANLVEWGAKQNGGAGGHGGNGAAAINAKQVKTNESVSTGGTGGIGGKGGSGGPLGPSGSTGRTGSNADAVIIKQ